VFDIKRYKKPISINFINKVFLKSKKNYDEGYDIFNEIKGTK